MTLVVGGWSISLVVHTAAEGKMMFLLDEESFCRLGSLGSGNFASKNASKIVETSSALGWKCLHCCSCKRSVKGQGNEAMGYCA